MEQQKKTGNQTKIHGKNRRSILRKVRSNADVPDDTWCIIYELSTIRKEDEQTNRPLARGEEKILEMNNEKTVTTGEEEEETING